MNLGIEFIHLIRLLAVCIHLVHATNRGYADIISKDDATAYTQRPMYGIRWMHYIRMPKNSCGLSSTPETLEDGLHYRKQVSVDKQTVGTAHSKVTEGDVAAASTDSSLVNSDEQTTIDNNKPHIDIISPSTPDLPPLDTATVDDKHHLLPTFNEYHAMRFEQGQKQIHNGDDMLAQSPSQQQLFPGGGQTASPQQIRPSFDRHSQDSPPASLNHHAKASTGVGLDASPDPQLGPPGEQLLAPSGASDSGAKVRTASSSTPVTERELGSTVPTSSTNHNASPSLSSPDGQQRAADSDESLTAGSSLDSVSHTTGQVSNPMATSQEVDSSSVKVDADSASTSTNNIAPGHVTLRRNVAALACGAKLLDSSRAIKSPEAVLNSNMDEYLNVPCSADKWFVVEVCEPVQLRVIELANYELFSSRVKTFKVYTSDRYPVKTWDLVDHFTAQDVKGLQTFAVVGETLIKYVKFEMVEHYGSQHYCPLTMIRLFGLVSDDLADYEEDQERNVSPPGLVEAGEAGGANRETGRIPAATPAANSNGPPVVVPPPDIGLDRPAVEANTPDEATQQQVDSNLPASASGTLPRSQKETAEGGDPVQDGAGDDAPAPDDQQQAADVSSSTDSQGQSDLEVGNAKESPQQQSESPVRVDVRPGGELDTDGSGHVVDVDTTVDGDQTVGRPSEGPGESDEGSQDPDSGTATGSDPSLASNLTPPVPSPSQSLPPPLPPRRRRVQRQEGVLGSRNASRSPSQVDVRPLQQQLDTGRRAFSFLADSVYQFLVEPIKALFIPSTPTGHPLAGAYNLSRLRPSSRDHQAVASLLAYQLLQGGRSSLSVVVESSPPTLPSRLVEGLGHLEACFGQLTTSQQEQEQLIAQGRVLVLNLSGGRQKSLLRECQAASTLLRIPFALKNTWEAVETSILHLFLAYREYWSIASHSLRWSWLGQSDPECPALPDFLLQPKSTTVDVETPVTSQSADSRSPAVQPPPAAGGRQNTPPRAPTPRARPSAQATLVPDNSENVVVVPASLSGSRKDAAWMRLSNRVRLLERNVSVSMGYLEELSQSYRRQMERLVRSFNLTTAWLKVTAQTAEARDQQQQSRLDALERRLEDLLGEVKSTLNLPPNSTSNATSMKTPTASRQAPPDKVPTTTPASFDWSLPPPVPWFQPPLQSSSQLAPVLLRPSSNAIQSSNQSVVGWWNEDDWLATGEHFDGVEDDDGVVEVVDQADDFEYPLDSLPRYPPADSGEASTGLVVGQKPRCAGVGMHHPAHVTCLEHRPSSLSCPDAKESDEARTRASSRTGGGWLFCWVRWLTTTGSTSADSQRWQFSVGSMLGMALLHITFAMFSHLLVYFAWLRPVVVRQTCLVSTSTTVTGVDAGKPDALLAPTLPHRSCNLTVSPRLDDSRNREFQVTGIVCYCSSSSSSSRASSTAAGNSLSEASRVISVESVSSGDHQVSDQASNGSITAPCHHRSPPESHLLRALSVCPVYTSTCAPSSPPSPSSSSGMMTSTQTTDASLSEPPVYVIYGGLSSPSGCLSNGGFEKPLRAIGVDEDEPGCRENLCPNSNKLLQGSVSSGLLKTQKKPGVSNPATTASVCETKLANGYAPLATSLTKRLTNHPPSSFDTCQLASDCSQLETKSTTLGLVTSDLGRDELATGTGQQQRRRKKWRWRHSRPSPQM